MSNLFPHVGDIVFGVLTRALEPEPIPIARPCARHRGAVGLAKTVESEEDENAVACSRLHDDAEHLSVVHAAEHWVEP